jgi:hypothetical protein
VRSEASFRQISLIHPRNQITTSDFYKKYEDLICHYAAISPYSIRAPHRVGSSFFFKTPISEKNKFKSGGVDTVDIDKFVRNPASYFAYKGYNKLYKFFSSPEFVELEKNFSIMVEMDVGKCFDSIYTHTISWALKDIHTSKENKLDAHFGASFDELMQHMNFNETNGICIGPEVSRIFAEIILAKVDLNVEETLSQSGYLNGLHYTVRRYVDNYYLFSNSDAIIVKIKSILSNKLREYKLHINEKKTLSYTRPFYTPKSKAIDATNIALRNFIKSCTEIQIYNGQKHWVPIRIKRYNGLLQTFIKDIKYVCYEVNDGYDIVANYIISSLTNRLIRITEDYDIKAGHALREEEYLTLITIMLELNFFFYKMSPTVASSLKVCTGLVISADFIRSKFPDRLAFIQEKVVQWTAELIRDPRFERIAKSHDAIPVEILNILIAMHDISADQLFKQRTFKEIFPDIHKMEYFSLVTCLFLIKDDNKMKAIKAEIFDNILRIMTNSKGINLVAHDAHLFLDTMTCPFLDQKQKRKLLTAARKGMKMRVLNNVEADALVTDLGRKPWFTTWDGVDLLSLIKKKQLSGVY